MASFGCSLSIHSWIFIMQKGVNRYYECKHCKERKVNCGISGYTPIDKKWLKNDNN